MESTDRLRLALRLNAGFSTLSALTLFAANADLGRAIGIDARLLIAVGVGLALFAVHLLYTAARTDLGKLRAEALRHSVADFAWVATSIGVILAGWLTPVGDALLGAVGMPVLALGVTQFRSLPLKSSGGQAPDLSAS